MQGDEAPPGIQKMRPGVDEDDDVVLKHLSNLTPSGSSS
jgi:hypothetical protein